MPVYRDRFRRIASAFTMELEAIHHEPQFLRLSGHVFFKLEDMVTGEIVAQWDKPNVVTLDGGLLVARLTKDPLEPPHGIFMLAVGTGANGGLTNPDAPSNEQRRLNNEIARKPFASTTYRDADGVAVAFPTNVVDFTTVFDQADAVGPLNEMGLLSPISANTAIINDNPNHAGQGGAAYDPTIDVTNYDLLANHLTFGVITKTATMKLTLTWRISF